ncbi:MULTISPECIES: FAD-dependent monooxygenase [unclassified Paenibacillus]|uniref:FAD-dependent monooxygenase n=1 Tax=unclassified Paenibacillus TaxID=185978 RepID=UPI001AE3FB69|nr:MULTISPECIES: FAD-dependent monooxygenase [unclassified Paenibacillus]MBP1155113.1 2-polyprenyl-6-methoxyphenol hydroxylase-like FAD-dependent oxidoreductase [Paenibacillus sp. PvP091]MBP1169503.1 2-polyprenyl-6-methoxyphenol hydroxylase-like FAD-dependent oxidoreductase [Paenibacillus sp. PvR098]MBP2440531.1 2-polyprenyl-6-methoxyphenol hydroxylase-like FAD-dependent oxidoreductase [Paenibacillus sp. PvP052]
MFNGSKAIIIGGGIGGLAAAIALQDSGWSVSVFEKTAELQVIGAGIVLAANAMKVLEKLGVADQVREQGCPVGKGEIRTWNGKLLVDLPVREQAQRFGSASYLIHRAALQSILYDQLKPGTVHWGKQWAEWRQHEERVVAVFADAYEEAGDILIGADGIHSSVRQRLFGPTPLRYAGFTALRGIAVFDNERYTREDGGGFEAWGPGKRFGFSQLGGDRVFWFAAVNAPQGSLLPPGKRKQAALRHFRGWYEPIEAVIEATEESAILSHDIFDRVPLRRWSQGPVTLLGDAAHPMLPNLGQGGAQALEDALMLARCVSERPSQLPEALLLYEQRRIQRTSLIVSRSRRMGRLMQLEHTLAVTARNAVLRTIPPRVQMNRMAWLIGHEV